MILCSECGCIFPAKESGLCLDHLRQLAEPRYFHEGSTLDPAFFNPRRLPAE